MKSSIQTAKHYNWGEGCDGWWLLKSDKFTVIEEKMPAGTEEKRHYHAKTDQFFYCLEGKLLIENDGKTIFLEVGEGLHVKAGSVHKIKNTQNQLAQFLVISVPNSHEDRIDVEDK